MHRVHSILLGALLWLNCHNDGSANDTGIIETELNLSAAQPGEMSALFSRIPEKESGLNFENEYHDPQMWGENFKLFAEGSVGTGVAVGDYDNDNRPDIFLVSKTGKNRLYRQIGHFRFEDVTDAARVGGSSAWSTGASFVDMDADGDLDLYVCYFNEPNELYINNGDGSFDEKASEFGLDITDASVMGSFADYDRDGDLDLYIVTNRLHLDRNLTGQPDYLLRNDGNGKFRNVSVSANILHLGQGHSATWLDYNHDGWLDLYIANDFKQPDQLYRNNGDGAFTNVIESTFPHMPFYSMGVDFADINNDGADDILVADMSATSHYKQKIAMGDMGGVVSQMNRLPVPQYMRNSLYLNTGTDRFMEIAYLAGIDSTDWTWAPRFADLDNDGLSDLFVTNGMIRNFMHSDLIMRVAQAQSKEAAARIYRNSPLLSEANLAYRNTGEFKFERKSIDWGLNLEGVSFGSAFADFDRDGDLDIIINNFDQPPALYRNESEQNRLLVKLIGEGLNSEGLGAAIAIQTPMGTQQRLLQPYRGVLSSDEALAHFGLGKETHVKSLVVNWPSGKQSTYTDLQANRLYTIDESRAAAKQAVATKADGSQHKPLFQDATKPHGFIFKHQEAVYNDFATQPLLPHRLSQYGPGAAWSDVNQDGRPDLYVAAAKGFRGQFFLSRANGSYVRAHPPQWPKESPHEEMGVLFFDIDGDGIDDLYLAGGGIEADPSSDALRDRAFLSRPHGLVPAKAQHPQLSSSNGPLAAADFDRDGDLDLFVGGRFVPGAYPTSPGSALLINDGGNLIEAEAHGASGLKNLGMVTSALWSDANNDGWLDLIVTEEWGTLRLFINQQGQLLEKTEEAGLSAFSGWWNSIIGADFDNDGDIDYAAGNLGLNTKYHASATKPVSIYYGYFGDESKPRLIEAKYEEAELYPVRGKSCSTNAMPFLGNRLPSFEAFAQANLMQIYGSQPLTNAERFESTHFENAVFINDGQGSFEYRPLPRWAQAAPGYGLAAQDFNGDMRIDLVMVQNFYGPQDETGRYNGGLGAFLSGNGDGSFNAEAITMSGLGIYGDSKSVTTHDSNQDGWPDLLVTRNQDTILAFENQGAKGSLSFALRLVGDKANRKAIGARVSVVYKDTTKQTAELYAGSGYLSQSIARLFFAYRAGNEPEEIQVRWPDGSQANYPWPGYQPQITLHKTSK